MWFLGLHIVVQSSSVPVLSPSYLLFFFVVVVVVLVFALKGNHLLFSQAERIREHKLKQDRKKRERDVRERKRRM